MTLTAPVERAPTRGPRVDRFEGVDGMVVVDVPAARASGGGTRLAADVSEPEMRLLARAMTYKLAVLGIPVGGAKIGLRGSSDSRTEVIARFREEIAPRLKTGELMTGPDLGTFEADFVGLPTPGGANGIAATAGAGMPVEQLLSGAGVVSAIAAAFGGTVEGRSVALEGFGKMGTSIAAALAARGGRIVAVSTIAGTALAPPGGKLKLSELLDANQDWRDELVHHVGIGAERSALWSVPCDALVPGARPGVLDVECAQRVAARAVVPVANAPYTFGGLQALKQRGVIAHADFLTSAGGAMAYLDPRVSGASNVVEACDALDDTMSSIVVEVQNHPAGPYAGAVARAKRYLAGWLDPADLPGGPPLV